MADRNFKRAKSPIAKIKAIDTQETLEAPAIRTATIEAFYFAAYGEMISQVMATEPQLGYEAPDSILGKLAGALPSYTGPATSRAFFSWALEFIERESWEFTQLQMRRHRTSIRCTMDVGLNSFVKDIAGSRDDVLADLRLLIFQHAVGLSMPGIAKKPEKHTPASLKTRLKALTFRHCQTVMTKRRRQYELVEKYQHDLSCAGVEALSKQELDSMAADEIEAEAEPKDRQPE